jgi:all-trans-retinol dehydrogenase (NAD+)
VTEWGASRVLVTGAAKGMGRELSRRVLAAGGHVIAWDMDAVALASLHDDAAAQPGTVETATVDVTDRERVEQAALEVGQLEILVNNAGIVRGGFLSEADPRDLELVMKVNTMSLFWVTRALLPGMVERNSGHIVTIASAAGLVPLRSAVSYTTSKHAAVGFHDSLRQELRTQAPGVRMTLVTPFFVNTGMFTGTKSRFDFLLPIVEQDDAVDRIWSAVVKDRNRVIMPATAAAAYALRILPTRVADVLLDQLGISSSMDEFQGPGTKANT